MVLRRVARWRRRVLCLVRVGSRRGGAGRNVRRRCGRRRWRGRRGLGRCRAILFLGRRGVGLREPWLLFARSIVAVDNWSSV